LGRVVRSRRTTDNSRPQRVGDLLIEFVAHLLSRVLDDPRLRSVTLTEVDVRPDLKHANIYFTVRDGVTHKDDALLGLGRATGFIRGRIATDLKLRFVPTIQFVHDDVPGRAQRIEHLLRSTRSKL